MGLRPLEQLLFKLLQCGDRLYTSESDVYRRQIMTYKDGPRAERFKRGRSNIGIVSTPDYINLIGNSWL